MTSFFFSLNLFGNLDLLFGGESDKVHEHRAAVLIFEFEAYPEPKVLSKLELGELMKQFKTTVAVAHFIGASQAFVWAALNDL